MARRQPRFPLSLGHGDDHLVNPRAESAPAAACAGDLLHVPDSLATLYLQVVRGYSALHAGLYSLPMAVMMLLLAPLSGRIVGSRGSRWPLVFAGVFMTIAPLLLGGLDVRTPAGVLVEAYLVFAAGMGLVNPPITTAAISGMLSG